MIGASSAERAAWCRHLPSNILCEIVGFEENGNDNKR